MTQMLVHIMMMMIVIITCDTDVNSYHDDDGGFLPVTQTWAERRTDQWAGLLSEARTWAPPEGVRLSRQQLQVSAGGGGEVGH